MAGNKSWTKEEELKLLEGAGTHSLAWLAKSTGRSRSAVQSKLYSWGFRGGLSRGSYSLYQASKETGYNRAQLKRAAHALGQQWRRLSRTGKFMITDDQLWEMLDWLKTDYWCKKHHLYACIWCGAKKRAHRAYGLCDGCFWKYAKSLGRLDLPVSCMCLIKELVNRLNLKKEARIYAAIRKNLDRGLAIDSDTMYTVVCELGGVDGS
jgi:hypothetical protein